MLINQCYDPLTFCQYFLIPIQSLIGSVIIFVYHSYFEIQLISESISEKASSSNEVVMTYSSMNLSIYYRSMLLFLTLINLLL